MPPTHNLATRGRYLDVAVAAIPFQILPFGEFRRQQGDLSAINLIVFHKFKYIYNKKNPPTHNIALRGRYLDVATSSFQILPFCEFRRQHGDL